MYTIALAGNPNSGKTTLFNSLTGSTAHTGNWPGVTVDKREGQYKKCEEPVSIIDLPGIYSLSPYTPEEVISRNYILDEKPSCLINIVDATNLERNLYLTTQLLEIDVPIVVALNMIDAVEKNGDKIDAKLLEEKLGVPVVKISALKGVGLEELMTKAYNEASKTRNGKTVLEGSKLTHLISDLKIIMEDKKIASPLFHAIKLVENDELETKTHSDAVEVVEKFKQTFDDDTFDNDFEAMIADERYKYISKNFSIALTKNEATKDVKMTKSDKADRVLTSKIWGIPIFIVVLFFVFHLTFGEDLFYLGAIFKLPSLEDLGMNTESYGVRWLATIYDGAVFSPGCIINNIWNDMLVGELCGWIQGLVEDSNLSAWAIGFINNGVIDGLSAVLSFLPQILVLFLFFAILEDSGYMARIAFILDRIFRKFGLSGRAFMPMIMGFGCSVPAMINARTLRDSRERLLTIRVIPFFSCGAKLPILTAVAGAIVVAFGIGNADLIVFGMYLLGMAAAIIAVLLMRSTTQKGEPTPFIMELPAYHNPQFKNLMAHLWDKAKHFVKKAFTIILLSTILIWFLSHFNFSWDFLDDEQIDESILAQISMLFQPLFTPLGFGSQLGKYGFVFVVGAVAGLIAKENVISTFATLAACLAAANTLDISGLDVTNEDGVDAVRAMIDATGITVPGLIAFIAFNMTTIPCFAAVGTAKAELGDKKMFRWTVVFWICASYIVAAIVFTVGTWWWTLFIWAAVVAGLIALIIFKNKYDKKKLVEA